MWGIVNAFFPNLYLIPYGEMTKHYAPDAKEEDIVGIFLNTEEFEDNDDNHMESFE